MTSNGGLNWNVGYDLCGQTGVVCDSSNPKRIIQLYFPFLFWLFFFWKKKVIKIKNRNLRNKGLQGSISSQFLSLSNLQNLYIFELFPFFEFRNCLFILFGKKIPRYLSLNYWDCPTPDYSFILSNDYFNISSECGFLLLFSSLFSL